MTDGATWHELDRLRDDVRRLSARVDELERAVETARYERQDADRRLGDLEARGR